MGALVVDLLGDEPATLVVAGAIAGVVLAGRLAFVVARRVKG